MGISQKKISIGQVHFINLPAARGGGVVVMIVVVVIVVVVAVVLYWHASPMNPDSHSHV